jgi:hypothetical protein
VHDNHVLEVKGKRKIESLMQTFGISELEVKTMLESEIAVDEVLTWLIVEMGALLAIRR